jgi:hypothetical protein
MAGLLLLPCLMLGLYFSGNHSPLSVGKPVQVAWEYVHTLPAVQGVETSWRADAKSIQCEKDYHVPRTRVIITRHICYGFDKSGVICDVRSGWGFKLAPPTPPVVLSRIYNAGTNSAKFMTLLAQNGVSFYPRSPFPEGKLGSVSQGNYQPRALVVWGTPQEQEKASVLLANLNRK